MSTTKTGTRSHAHELSLEAPPERVWQAITDPAELPRWFPLEAAARPGQGGVLTYRWGPDISIDCRIEVWDPPRHLRTTWFEPVDPSDPAGASGAPLAVDWQIDGRAGRSVLRLVHSGFGHDAQADEEFDGTRRGWTFELSSLKHYLAHHAGRPRIAFWARKPTSEPATAVWARMTQPGTFLREGTIEGLVPGERYRIVLASGDVLEGSVTMNLPPKEFAGTVENLGHGLMRIGFEACGGGPQAHLWLSTWGVPASDVQALERRVRDLL